jgi:hypothetical protein
MREYPCLASRGRSPDCQTCSIGQAGLLADFVDLLSGMSYTLRTRQGLQDADREVAVLEQEKNDREARLVQLSQVYAERNK